VAPMATRPRCHRASPRHRPRWPSRGGIVRTATHPKVVAVPCSHGSSRVCGCLRWSSLCGVVCSVTTHRVHCDADIITRARPCSSSRRMVHLVTMPTPC
jgi:hypothetical protein